MGIQPGKRYASEPVEQDNITSRFQPFIDSMADTGNAMGEELGATRVEADSANTGTVQVADEVSALQSRIDGHDDDIAALQAQPSVAAVEQRVTAAEGDISSLDGRVSTTEGDIAGHGTRLSSAESDISALQSRADGNDADIAALSAESTAAGSGWEVVRVGRACVLSVRGSNGNAITLPEEYRPAIELYVSVAYGATSTNGRMRLRPSGEVRFLDAAGPVYASAMYLT